MDETTLNSAEQSTLLNIPTFPLTGRRLIEASAGTGKTFSITHIYLRLLLGLGENNFLRPLSVQEILVVTFTNAATEELRSRIRQTIVAMKLLFQSEVPDPNSELSFFVASAQKQQKDPAELIQLLIAAEQSIDEAAIYTIDGFSLKMSKQFSLLLKETDELTLIDDQNALLLNSVQAFWRKYFYPIQSTLLANEITQTFGSPQTLFTQLKPFFNNSAFIEHLITKSIPQILSDFEADLKLYQNHIFQIKQFWQSKKINIVADLLTAKLHQNTYSEQKILTYIETVDLWCNNEFDLEYPEALKKFYFSNLEAKKIKSSDLSQLDSFYLKLDSAYSNCTKPNLNVALFESLLKEVYLDLETQKQQNQLFAHGDPLKQLVNGLNNSFIRPILTESIHSLFPVALIDEFQDTDALQYQFFDRIYQDKTKTGLILIGDPKQAIYGFRGGDVFTYIQAKNQADSVHSIQCNYRSSKHLIESVNAIFSTEDKNVFKYNEIPFYTVDFAEKNKFKALCFDLNHPTKNDPSFEIHTVDCAEADFCAAKIAQWLTHPAYLIDDEQATNAKKLQASDIAILVRSSAQALQMQTALNHYSISSSYFSDHESVFKSIEATWIFYLLDAILNPSHLSKISLASATPLFNLSMLELQTIQEEGKIEQLVQQLVLLEKSYQKSGIYVMLQTLLTQNQIAATLLQQENGNRHITNLLHLSELLQTASQTHQSLHTLTEWFKIQMDKTTTNSAESIQRLDNDENVVKIFTLHGSKGLEFPVVCLPFLSKMEAKAPKPPFLYHIKATQEHNKTSYPLCLALEKDEIALQQKKQEEEAELIRLAYVAMTRPVYHCLAILKESKASLIGNLLSQQKTIPIQNSSLFEVKKCTVQPGKPAQLEVAKLTRAIDPTWQMISYSSLLQRQLQRNTSSLLPLVNETLPNQIEEHLLPDPLLNPQTTVNQPILLQDFPKGAFVGTLLHQLLENSQLKTVLQPELVEKVVSALNLDPVIYAPILKQFYQQLIQTPLTQAGLTLSQIPFKKQLNEFHFLLPIKHKVTEQQFNYLMRKFDPLSKQTPYLQFETLKGMLTGFIDLVFESEGKYYIADYKSNYLGADQADYHETQLSQAMIHHRYDLQYQLYTLALHRYLRLRLPNYDYEKDFGGVFYLFLRGMNGKPQNGVYFCRPDFAFIQQLDTLFQK